MIGGHAGPGPHMTVPFPTAEPLTDEDANVCAEARSGTTANVIATIPILRRFLFICSLYAVISL
jgi:hypothetical protein